MTMNLFKVATKFGNIYIEQPRAEYREEEDRIKIFDSKKRYIDYIPVDGMEEDEICSAWANYVCYLCNAEDFETLLNKLVGGDDNWSFHSEDLVEVMDMMKELEEWNGLRDHILEELEKAHPYTHLCFAAEHEHAIRLMEENEWILFIGDEIVLLYEY